MRALADDDVVEIRKGNKPGDPHVITVNCPGRTDLSCDICRAILDFGLYITKGDVTTDGIWCYIVFWVAPHSSSPFVRWPNLKNRLVSVCPPCSFPINVSQQPGSSASPVYLLTFFCLDRQGLLNDVTQVLCELELTIQRVKVTTTPDGRVLDLFFVTDNLNLLHTREQQGDTYKRLNVVLDETCLSCEIKLAGPEYELCQVVSLSPGVEEELFQYELSDREIRSRALSADMTRMKTPDITVDNSLSPAHTLLQIHCIDHKGLLYDVMRTLKDCNINIIFEGSFHVSSAIAI